MQDRKQFSLLKNTISLCLFNCPMSTCHPDIKSLWWLNNTFFIDLERYLIDIFIFILQLLQVKH
jgi:hypothetical protein